MNIHGYIFQIFLIYKEGISCKEIGCRSKKWKELGMLFQKSQIINSVSHKIQFVGSSLLHIKETHIKELGFKKMISPNYIQAPNQACYLQCSVSPICC